MQHSSAENSWRNYDQFFLEKDFFVHTLLLAAEQLNDEMKKFFFTLQDIFRFITSLLVHCMKGNITSVFKG